MKSDPSKVLVDVIHELSMASTLKAVTRITTIAAREIAGSSGSTFILREGGLCYYVDEDAISPLWKGERFPMAACISGWAMIHKQSVLIPDIYKDERIPHDAYRPTFVKSLCMIPIRAEDPIGVIGNYWSDGYLPSKEEIHILQILANSTAIALNNLELKKNIIEFDQVRNTMIDRQKDLEAAIHTLAHDLRNPLSTLMLMAQALEVKLGTDLAEKNNKYFLTIHRTGNQMNEQIKRMLSLYGILQRKLECERIDITEMAEKIAVDLKNKFPERKISFEIDSGLTAMADPVLIQVAMENLIGNAVKYTGKKELALVQFHKSENDKEGLNLFCIKDNGDGFESNQAIKLFRPMVRLHTNNDFQGTGLGLASVARIIEMHGGTIRAEGEKHVGAKFFFDLPIAV